MGELSFKQASSEARQMHRALRAFEKVEEVLTAAASAMAREEGLEEKIRLLAESAEGWEEKVKTARAQYSKEQVIAGTEMDRLRALAIDASAVAEREKEEALDKTRRQIEEAQRAGERGKRALTVQCEELEEKREGLEEKLKQANADYDAFCAKVGVS